MALTKVTGTGLETLSDGVTITTADNTTQLTLASTDADASVGPVLDLYRNSSSPADGDRLGSITLRGRNDNSQDVTYATIRAFASDVSDGTEDTEFELTTILAGTEVARMTTTGPETVFNQAGADIDFRVESDGNANMLFVDGGSDHVNIGSNSDAGGVLNVSDGTSFSTGIVVENTGDTHGSVITFSNNSSSPADGDYIGGLIFKETNSAGGTHLYGKIFGIASDITDGTEDGALTFETSAAGANTSERMRIDASGNVGIGDTSPARKLHVNSGATNVVAQFESTDGTAAIELKDNAGAAEVAAVGNSLAFMPAGTERARIDSSGRLLIAKTSHNFADPGFEYHPDQALNIIRSGGASLNLNRLTDHGDVITFFFGGTDVGSINVDGSSTAYSESSDYRLKENVDYTWDATTRLKQLKPARFNFISDDTNTLIDGFLAHEVSSIVPNAVTGEKDAVYPEGHEKAGEIKTQRMDKSRLVPLLVKTIQELEARITALEG